MSDINNTKQDKQEILGEKISKHEQVYLWLKSIIDTNKFDEGTRLPTEEELAKQFGMNRMTIRKAMARLVDEGLVVRIKRKGTFLSDAAMKRKHFYYDLNQIISFENILKDKKMTADYRVYERSIVDVSPHVAVELVLPENSSVLRICRIISVNGEPIFLEKSYFPYPKFKDMLNMDFNKPNIYASVTKALGCDLAHSSQTLIAGLMDANEKEQLKYDKNIEIPCIRQQNIIYDDKNNPVFTFHATFPGDKFRFVVSSRGYKPDLV